MRNDLLRVHDFNIVAELDVFGGDDATAFFVQAQSHFIATGELEHHPFEVEQNIDHIFLHAINR